MKYNWVEVIETVRFDYTYYGKKRRFEIVKCICNCWKEFENRLVSIKSWNTKSCWCIKKEKMRIKMIEFNTKHWFRKHRLYKTRSWMHQRCKHENHRWYKYYWWRWISVCEERENVESFINDMYPTFQEWLSLDRIDVNWNYCKENCRRATNEEQALNKRPKTKTGL